MILPDVNVLIYAFRSEVPQFKICRPWLEGVLADSAPFGLSSAILAAVARITTNPRSYAVPTSLERAFEFCNYLVSQPHCRMVEPAAGHWNIFQHLCLATNTRGAMVTDAWFAALAIESGCEWITMDRDFARFPGLRWRTPDAD